MRDAITQRFSNTSATSAQGTNLDIDGWLREIGLEQYAQTFQTNDIDGEMLGRLTNDDLKEIGVASFGHRKRCWKLLRSLPVLFQCRRRQH